MQLELLKRLVQEEKPQVRLIGHTFWALVEQGGGYAQAARYWLEEHMPRLAQVIKSENPDLYPANIKP